MGDLIEAIARLRGPLRVEAFNHIEAGRPYFMAMIVRDPEPGVAEILGQQMQDQTAEDICLVVNTAADELSALRAQVDGLAAALTHLENANDALAAKRSRATYLAMEADARDELIMLDEARRNARAAIRTALGGDGE